MRSMLAFWMGGAANSGDVIVVVPAVDYEFTVQISRSEAWSASINRTHEFTTEINRTETLPSPLS